MPIPDAQAGAPVKEGNAVGITKDDNLVFDVCNSYLDALIRGSEEEKRIFGKAWDAIGGKKS